MVSDEPHSPVHHKLLDLPLASNPAVASPTKSKGQQVEQAQTRQIDATVSVLIQL